MRQHNQRSGQGRSPTKAIAAPLVQKKTDQLTGGPPWHAVGAHSSKLEIIYPAPAVVLARAFNVLDLKWIDLAK